MADKGINLPDSELHLSAMTDRDCADGFVAEHADMVALVRQHGRRANAESFGRMATDNPPSSSRSRPNAGS
jgi:hypothetical protein